MIIALSMTFVAFIGAMILVYGIQRNNANKGKNKRPFPLVPVLGIWLMVGTSCVGILIAYDPAVSPIREEIKK